MLRQELIKDKDDLLRHIKRVCDSMIESDSIFLHREGLKEIERTYLVVEKVVSYIVAYDNDEICRDRDVVKSEIKFNLEGSDEKR